MEKGKVVGKFQFVVAIREGHVRVLATSSAFILISKEMFQQVNYRDCRIVSKGTGCQECDLIFTKDHSVRKYY
jgi:hypothetical protein